MLSDIVKISSDGYTATVNMPNKKIETPTSTATLVVNKVDNDTGAIINSSSQFYVYGGGISGTKTLPNGTISIPVTSISSSNQITVQEISAPTGYQLDSTALTFILDKQTDGKLVLRNPNTVVNGRYLRDIVNVTYSGNNSIVTVTMRDKKIEVSSTATLVVNKVDNDTGAIINSSSQFYVYGGGISGTKTLPNGTISIPVTSISSSNQITVQEISAPTGYQLDSTPLTFTLDKQTDGKLVLRNPNTVVNGRYLRDIVNVTYSGNNSIVTVTMRDKKIESGANIVINKVDNDTGAVINSQASFYVYGGGVSGTKVLPNGTTGSMPLSIIGNTSVSITVQEISAPTGYQLDSTPLVFTLDKQTDGKLVLRNPNTIVNGRYLSDIVKITYNGNDSLVTVNVRNKKIINTEATLIINKIDADTKTIINSESQFYVYGGGIAGTKTLPNGTISMPLTSIGGSNQITVQEILAPTGYELNSTPLTFTLNKQADGKLVLSNTNLSDRIKISYSGNNSIITVSIENKKIEVPPTEILIQKVDSVTGKNIENNPATFTITGSGSFSTNSAGQITLNVEGNGELEYKIKETKEPNGYILDETEYTLTLNRNETTGVVTVVTGKTSPELRVGNTTVNGKTVVTIGIPNTQKYDIEIIKVDKNGKAILDNPAKFLVTCNKGEALGNRGTEFYTNREKGIALIPNIAGANGDYVFSIKELESPSGYILNESTYNLSINVNRTNGEIKYNSSSTSSELVANGIEIVEDSVTGKVTIRIKIKNYQKNFDLSLQKFVSSVEGMEEATIYPNPREPKVNVDSNGKVTFTKSNEAVVVTTGKVVRYTIRVYNEGLTDGYATKISDNIPEGLEFLPDHQLNKNYKWQELNGKIISTYLSDKILKAFDRTTMQTPDYKDIQIAFKIKENAPSIIENIAEIYEDKNEYDEGDVDSTPADGDLKQDDIDKALIKPVVFDLSLRKFITAVNGKEVTGRETKLGEKKPAPVEVTAGDTVVYTIKVYNEGNIDGYAKKVIDNVPVGLKFDSSNQINKDNKWTLSEDGKQVISTLLENKKIDAINGTTMDYEEIKIAFIVEETKSDNRVITNIAEIYEHYNDYEIKDRDSLPANGIATEDDIDTEQVKLVTFDLSLKKFVAKTTVIVNGEVKENLTGYNGDEDPKKLPKIEINQRTLGVTTIKVTYTIKVTNEGEIAGYAKEIKDYIPQGMTFSGADNPNWKAISSNQIVTTQLEDTKLEPGQSAEVTVVLTWVQSENNIGEIINTAEISKDHNDKGIKDKDSTPNNYKGEEDDQDYAPVLITILTGGETIIYVTLTTSALGILAAGIFLIKKYVIV